MYFDFSKLSADDLLLARSILGWELRAPDLVIAPDGKPYLYRWHLIPHSTQANVYFHIQVDSDPERPLHDHPWENQSVILSGGYDELINFQPMATPIGEDAGSHAIRRPLRKGDVVHRLASEAHRLILPPQFPYTMTIFSTGPKVRTWGFWFTSGFKSYSEVTEMRDGSSQMKAELRHVS